MGAPRVLRPAFAGSRRETPTIRTFLFDPGERQLAFEPGQFVSLTLEGLDDPRGPRRSFTLSSSPAEGPALALTTRLTHSPFKRRLAALEPGETVELRGPFGRFRLEDDRPAVMLAGGVGVTPFRSMLRHAADRGPSAGRVLLYSCRTPEEIAFGDELTALDREHEALRVVITVTRPGEGDADWNGPTGRFDAQRVRDAASGLARPLYYVCGPSSMVEGVSDLLTGELGIDEDELRTETFPGYD